MCKSETSWVSRANYNALKEEIAGLNLYIKKLRVAAHSTSTNTTKAEISLLIKEWESLPEGIDYLYGVNNIFKKLRKLSALC